MKSIILILAILASVVTVSPALAQEPAVRVVQTGDLDLANMADRRQLDRRLHRATIEVCGEASVADLEGQNLVRKCRVATLARAQAESSRLASWAWRNATVTVAAAD